MNLTQTNWDVIVCGAGHAGCEAALTAARRGARTLLLTGNLDTIAQMSCNPAIGGQAKGHIVREIDALGGAMALTADTTAIQFRLLNRSKGPAVQAPRVQSDKRVYQQRMKHLLELQPSLAIFQALVTGLEFKSGQISGVQTNLGLTFKAQTVIVTTGTFLRARLHVGQNKNEGGRMGDFSAQTLSSSFIEAGIELDRFKTGTPCRLLGSSLDFTSMDEQPGDEKPCLFAFYDTRDLPEMFHVEHSSEDLAEIDHQLFHVEQSGQRLAGWIPGQDQVSCWMTYTSSHTAEVIRDNLHLSPLYAGEIEGVGPRYCPSIEDKIVKFADKERHRLFLEPEGRNSDEWYVNGLSTSLPFPVQEEFLRSIPGLERSAILRPAYAVEYDYAPPTQLWPSLESRKVEGLFFAGQINGTSGYEEAAGQGLLAGINAVSKLRGEPALVLGRHQAYLGVLIDDLVTKGTNEPYRMFTSRAEHRLLLNHNSAEIRLAGVARSYGLMEEKRIRQIERKMKRVEEWCQQLEKEPGASGSIADALRRGEEPHFLSAFLSESQSLQAEVKYRIRYAGYLERERKQVARLAKTEHVMIPDDIDYHGLKGLRKEGAQKLDTLRPKTLGQASRISGVNPADINILLIALAAHRSSPAIVTE